MMMTSETTGELFTALAKFQGECRGAGKGGKNPHLRNNYTRLEDAWSAAREPLTSNGLSVVQMPCAAPDGFVAVATRVCHASGEWIEATQHMPISAGKGVTAAQSAGSALSYAKRYAFMAALGLPSVDDDAEGTRGKGGPAKVEAGCAFDDARKALGLCQTQGELDACVARLARLPNEVKVRLAGDHAVAVERVKGAA